MIEFAFLLLLLIGLTQISIHRNRFISPLLAVSLTIYIMCWNIFPFLYSIFMSERTDNIISNPTYQKVVLIQLISVFTILMLFNILNILSGKSRMDLLIDIMDLDFISREQLDEKVEKQMTGKK